MFTRLNKEATVMKRFIGSFYEKIGCSCFSVSSKVSDNYHNLEIPFQQAKIGQFLQDPPMLGNQYQQDTLLKSYMKRYFLKEVHSKLEADVSWFGERVATDIRELGEACGKQPPYLTQYDAWGKRVDDIWTCDAWKRLKAVAAEEGLIATAYKQPYGEYSRIYQVIKNYMWAPHSGLYSCPLAMTDGAAKVLHDMDRDADLEAAYQSLTSMEPRQFWTSGQWMTERKGGSDVGRGTETLAIPQSDGTYALHGYKWFTSATDSDMSITLARVVDAQGKHIEGSRGLSMFFLRVRDDAGVLNNITVQRLKDKLGTRQLPTAELLLHGAKAKIISAEGRGVPSIASMLNITRMHNSLAATGSMRKAVQLVKDYSKKRSAFGKVIQNHSLHTRTVANIEVETRGCFLLTMELARLLGLEETSKATEHHKDLLRILTPLAKLYTAKQAVAVTSESLECFGGLGYLEDSGLPVMLRDAQVLPIWEGTTNILSLDVLRVQTKSKGTALQALLVDIKQRLENANPNLSQSCDRITGAVTQITSVLTKMDNVAFEHCARELAMSLSHVYIGVLLVEHASWAEATDMDVFVANRWCSRDLAPLVNNQPAKGYGATEIDQEYHLTMSDL